MYLIISQIECLLPANVVKVLVKIIDGKQKKKNPVYESATRFVSYYRTSWDTKVKLRIFDTDFKDSWTWKEKNIVIHPVGYFYWKLVFILDKWLSHIREILRKCRELYKSSALFLWNSVPKRNPPYQVTGHYHSVCKDINTYWSSRDLLYLKNAHVHPCLLFVFMTRWFCLTCVFDYVLFEFQLSSEAAKRYGENLMKMFKKYIKE